MTTTQTTAQIAAQNLAALDSRLGQVTPTQDKAFNRALAVTEAMLFTSLSKYAADRAQAAFALSAQSADLDARGSEVGVTRNGAVGAIITASLPATDGTIVALGQKFMGSNGLVYQTTSAQTSPYGVSGSGVILTLQCLSAGALSNLGVGATLNIVSQVAGAGTVATVMGTTTTGADADSDPRYRPKVLDATRSQPTGSNATAYRLWAQSVPGVIRAYPYAGRVNPSTGSLPGERTVCVEVDTSIDPDGLAPAGILSQVRTAITTDPATGLGRQDLGLTDATLYVQSITRIPIYVTISGLTVTQGSFAACQADINTALVAATLKIVPFCSGADAPSTRLDTLRQTYLSKVVEGVLTSYGAYIQSLAFGLALGVNLPLYQAQPGERLKLAGGVATYV